MMVSSANLKTKLIIGYVALLHRPYLKWQIKSLGTPIVGHVEGIAVTNDAN